MRDISRPDLQIVMTVRSIFRKQRKCARTLVPRKWVHTAWPVDVLACALTLQTSSQTLHGWQASS